MRHEVCANGGMGSGAFRRKGNPIIATKPNRWGGKREAALIEGLKIAGCASYSAEGQNLTELRKINFIFGANGSGKTSISRVIAAPADHPACAIRWVNQRPLDCLVYNADFVERNFRSSLPGIFTLGENDGAVLDKIEQAKKHVEDIERDISARNIVLNGKDGGHGKVRERADLRENIENECWKLKNRHDADFQSAFAGVRGSKASFCDKILSEWTSNQAAIHPLDDLKKRAAVIFEKGLKRESAIRVPESAELRRLEALPILAKKVVGQGDVDIAGLIDRLGNSDWVKQGIGYFVQSTPQCPFCQQDVEADLAKRIQEKTQGGLPPERLRQLDRMAEQLRVDGDIELEHSGSLKPGTRLVRHWHGKVHCVTVLDDGFEFEQQRYSSLTQIARHITSAAWSGPRFFGLRNPRGETR